MLNFKPITLEARRDLLPFLGKKHHSACYQSFATMYLWSGIYQTRYCLTGEWLFTKSGREDGYGFPYGDGDLKEGITLLRQDAEENGKELWFFGLLPTEKAWLEANYPGEFTYTASRDDAEYIYEADKLMTYAGKKLHGKRNFCNRFEAAHPDWRFEPITAENMEAVLEFHRRWQVENEGGDEGLHKEGCVVRCALRELEELEGLGFGELPVCVAKTQYSLSDDPKKTGAPEGFAVTVRSLRVSAGAGFVVALTGDVMTMPGLPKHPAAENIEKADGEEPGAYPMVCREMAKMMKQKYPGLVFINREEDTGDEGLRRSKESYCPVMLLEKYVTREAK